jgi:hypothetical protein
MFIRGLTSFTMIKNVQIHSKFNETQSELGRILVKWNQAKNLDLILEYYIIVFFLYSIINIDLNVPCYFASIQEMINDYSININKYKYNSLFHICMLKLDECHMNVIHVQRINQQHGSHINILRKNKINDS